jgi:hypothetical protein
MALPQKTAEHPVADIMEAVLLKGDLIKLTPEERLRYYNETCRSLGLNPLTRPFEYLMLNGKLQLYARRDATDQLRKLHGISVKILNQKISNDLLTVHVQAHDKDGREDEDIGAISFPDTLRGEIRSNAIMKAVTKAKRRVTLSICGLGLTDESEIDDIPGAARQPVPEIEDKVLEPEDRITDELVRQTEERGPPDFIRARSGSGLTRDDLVRQAERENETDAVKQAGMRCADPRFHKFLEETNSAWKLMKEGTPTERAAELVRAIVGVKSRKDIVVGSEAAEHWHDLEGRFQAWLRA